MTIPNFIVLGAAKAGTTALYHYLGQHPEVCMSRTKETNFLALKDDPLDFRGPGDRDYITRFSVTTLDGYRDQFRGCGAKPAIGEASPLYLYSPKAPGLIGEVVPDAKLIVILRNPIDRAYSAFLHLVRDGRETVLDFGEALRLEDERSGTAGSTSGTTGGWAIISPSWTATTSSSTRRGSRSISIATSRPTRSDCCGTCSGSSGSTTPSHPTWRPGTMTPPWRRSSASPAPAGPAGAPGRVPRGHPEARAPPRQGPLPVDTGHARGKHPAATA